MHRGHPARLRRQVETPTGRLVRASSFAWVLLAAATLSAAPGEEPRPRPGPVPPRPVPSPDPPRAAPRQPNFDDPPDRCHMPVVEITGREIVLQGGDLGRERESRCHQGQGPAPALRHRHQRCREWCPPAECARLFGPGVLSSKAAHGQVLRGRNNEA
jgi:hypothetical protein